MSSEQPARTWIPRDEYRKLKAETARTRAKEATRAHRANEEAKATLEKWAAARTKVISGTLALTYKVPWTFRVSIPPANCQHKTTISGCCRAKLAEEAADAGVKLRPMVTMQNGVVGTSTFALFLDALYAGKWSNESYAGRFGVDYPRGCADVNPPDNCPAYLRK